MSGSRTVIGASVASLIVIPVPHRSTGAFGNSNQRFNPESQTNSAQNFYGEPIWTSGDQGHSSSNSSTPQNESGCD
jgi:hypothetical protein